MTVSSIKYKASGLPNGRDSIILSTYNQNNLLPLPVNLLGQAHTPSILSAGQLQALAYKESHTDFSFHNDYINLRRTGLFTVLVQLVGFKSKIKGVVGLRTFLQGHSMAGVFDPASDNRYGKLYATNQLDSILWSEELRNLCVEVLEEQLARWTKCSSKYLDDKNSYKALFEFWKIATAQTKIPDDQVIFNCNKLYTLVYLYNLVHLINSLKVVPTTVYKMDSVIWERSAMRAVSRTMKDFTFPDYGFIFREPKVKLEGNLVDTFTKDPRMLKFLKSKKITT